MAKSETLITPDKYGTDELMNVLTGMLQGNNKTVSQVIRFLIEVRGNKKVSDIFQEINKQVGISQDKLFAMNDLINSIGVNPSGTPTKSVTWLDNILHFSDNETIVSSIIDTFNELKTLKTHGKGSNGEEISSLKSELENSLSQQLAIYKAFFSNNESVDYSIFQDLENEIKQWKPSLKTIQPINDDIVNQYKEHLQILVSVFQTLGQFDTNQILELLHAAIDPKNKVEDFNSRLEEMFEGIIEGIEQEDFNDLQIKDYTQEANMHYISKIKEGKAKLDDSIKQSIQQRIEALSFTDDQLNLDDYYSQLLSKKNVSSNKEAKATGKKLQEIINEIEKEQEKILLTIFENDQKQNIDPSQFETMAKDYIRNQQAIIKAKEQLTKWQNYPAEKEALKAQQQAERKAAAEAKAQAKEAERLARQQEREEAARVREEQRLAEQERLTAERAAQKEAMYAAMQQTRDQARQIADSIKFEVPEKATVQEVAPQMTEMIQGIINQAIAREQVEQAAKAQAEAINTVRQAEESEAQINTASQENAEAEARYNLTQSATLEAEALKMLNEEKERIRNFQPISYSEIEDFLRKSEYFGSASLSNEDIQSKFGVDDKIIDSGTATLEQYQEELNKYNDILKDVSSRKKEIITTIQSLYNENFGNLSQIEIFPKLAKEWDETDDITIYFNRRIDILQHNIEQYQEKIQEFQEITRFNARDILRQQESYKSTDAASSDIKDIFGLNTDFSTPMEQLKAYEKAQDDLIEKRSAIYDKAKELYNSSKGDVQNNTEFQDLAIDLKHLDQAREYFDQIIPDIQKSVEEYKKTQEELAKPVQSGANGSNGSNGSGLPISPEQIQAITDGINNLVKAFEALNKAIGQIDEKNPNTIIESLAKFTTHNDIDFKFMTVQTQHLKSIIDEFQELNKSFGSTDEKKGIGTLLTQLHDLTKVIDEMDFGKLDNLKIQLQNVFSLDGGVKSQKMQITSALLEVKKLIEDLTLFKIDQGLNISKHDRAIFDSTYRELMEDRRTKGNIGAESDLVYQQNIFNSLIEILKKAGVEVSDFEKRYSNIMAKLQASTSNSLPQGLQEMLNPGQQSVKNINIINTSLDELISRLETIGNLISSSMGLGTIFSRNDKNESVINPIDFSKIGLNANSQTTTDVNAEVSGFQGLVDVLRSTIRLIENKNQQLERELRIVQDNIPQESQLFTELNNSLSVVRDTLSQINTELSKIDFSKFKLSDNEIGTKLTVVATQLQTIANIIPNISFDKFNPASNATIMASDLEKINKDLQGIVQSLGQIDFSKLQLPKETVTTIQNVAQNITQIPQATTNGQAVASTGVNTSLANSNNSTVQNIEAETKAHQNNSQAISEEISLTDELIGKKQESKKSDDYIVWQKGEIGERGSAYLRKYGVASTQTTSYVADKEGKIRSVDSKLFTNFDLLKSKITEADKTILQLEYNIEALQKSKLDVDVSPLQEKLKKEQDNLNYLLSEAAIYSKPKSGFIVDYNQFEEARKENIEKTLLDLIQKGNIEDAKTALKVTSSQNQLGKQLFSVDKNLWEMPQFQSLFNQISDAKSLGDIENAKSALQSFLDIIKDVKSNIGNDGIQKALDLREGKGESIIQDYVDKFQKLGLSVEEAKEKVKELQDAFVLIKAFNLNSSEGLSRLENAYTTFQNARYKTEATYRTDKEQKIANDKAAKETKAANKETDLNYYNRIVVAIKNVTQAQSDLDKLYNERSNKPIFGKDYVQEIEQAEERLKNYKQSLQEILNVYKILSGKTSERNIFTGNENISVKQDASYQKTYDKMLETENTFNNNRVQEALKYIEEINNHINAAKEGYKSYAEELQKYVNMLSEAASGKYTDEQLKTQKEKVDELKQAYVNLESEALKFVSANELKNEFKDLSEIINKTTQAVGKEGMQNILAKYQEAFSTSKGVLTSPEFNLNLDPSVSNLEEKLNSLRTDLETTNITWEEFVDGLNKISPDLQGLNVASDQIKGFSEQFKTYGQEIATHTDTWKQKIKEVKLAMQAMFDARDTDGFQTKVQELLRLLGELDKYRAATETKNAKGAIVSEGDVKSVDDLTQKMGEFAQQAKLGTEISRQVNESTGEATIRYRSLSGSITEVKGHIEQLTGAWRMQMSSISSSNTFITGFTSSLKGMFQGLTRFASATMLASKFRSEITKGLSTFKEYNATLTNISYTMNLTSKELDTLGKSAIDMAKDLSMSISNAESVYKIYANMNTSIEEIQRMAKPTVILSNLSGVDASTAADEVQGIIQQFNMLKESEDDVADVSMHVVDVLDNISANIAMDYSKGISVITQAVTATGQVAHDAGMSFEQLAAISAKVAERTREDGSTIGNAMKTIITRISKVGKMPQYAEEVDNDVLSKASESLNSIGIQVYQSNGEMNDMITILSQLREKWDSLTDAQQANISFNIAATRQTSKFKNILEAWTDSMALADQATQTQGNALENQEKYEESVAGKMQQLRTQMDSFWVEFYNSDATKGIIDFLINLAKAFNDLGKAIGPLGALSTFLFGGAALRGGITGLFSFIKGTNFLRFDKTLQLLSAGKLLRNMKAAGHDLPIIQQAMQNMYGGTEFGKNFGTAKLDDMMLATGWGAFLKSIAPIAATFAGITAAVIGTKYAIDTFSQSTDKLIERNNKLVTAQQKVADEHKSVISENNRNAESLQKLLTQYEAAEVGSEEYYNVRAQIADQFEDLIVGWDSEGRAIIANTETIRNLIQAYHDLSFAEAEAMRKEAAQNLNDSIFGNNDGIFGNGGNGAKQLIEKRKKLLDNIASLNNSIENPEDQTANFWDTDPDKTEGYDPVKSNQKQIEDYQDEIKTLDDQLINLRSHWKQQYGLLAGDLTGLTTEQTDALNALEELSVRYGEVSDDFTNMWTNLKYSDPERQKGFAETINALLYPDLSNISVGKDSYKDYINKYLGDLVKYMGNYMDQEEYNELVYELKIDTTQDTFNKQIEDILNNADYQAMADKLEINLEDILKKKNLSDIQLFNADNFFSDEAKAQIEQQFGEELKKLKELTNVGLMDVDWAKASSYSAEEYINAFNEAISRGIDTSQTQFGNIDLTNRQKLYNSDGSISTVLGTSSEYNGIEVAYSPILQTENGPKELSKDVIDKYIGGLFEQLPEKWYDEDLLKLDATGLEIDGLKIKNLIAGIGDTARDTAENMHLIEEIRLNDIALNRGTLTDSESVAKDVAQSLIGKGVAKDIQSAIDLMERWQWITDATAEAVTKDFDTFKGDTTESLKKAGESLTALNSAMSEMNKNGYVTKQTYTELTEANDAYSEALIMTTKGLTLDRKKVKQLRKDEVQLIRTKINDKYEELRNTYKANIEEVAKLEDELRNMENAEKADRAEKEAKIQALNKANLAIQGNISSLQQLRGELASTTGYYAEWQAAISNGSHGDKYNTIQSWLEDYKELAKKGFFGNESLEAFTTLFTGKTDFEFGSTAQYANMITKFGEKYFTEDNKGGIEFYKEIRKAVEEAAEKDDTFSSWLIGDEDVQIGNMEELAMVMTEHFRNKFGEGWEDFVMTNDLLDVMSSMLTEIGIWNYGDGAVPQTEKELEKSITRMEEAKAQLEKDGKEGSILWQMYDQAIQNANQSLFELQVTAAEFTDKDQLDSYVTDIVDTLNKETSNKDHELEIPLVFTSKNEAESTLQQLLQMREELEASGQGDEKNETTGLTRLEEINALISFVLGQKQEFEKPWIMTVDTSQFEDEKFGEFVTKLQEYHKAYNELEQALASGDQGAIDQAREKVVGLNTEIQKLDKESNGEFSLKVGIDFNKEDSSLAEQINNILPFDVEKKEENKWTINLGIDETIENEDKLTELSGTIQTISEAASSITLKINPGKFDPLIIAAYLNSLMSLQKESDVPLTLSTEEGNWDVIEDKQKELDALKGTETIDGKLQNVVYLSVNDDGSVELITTAKDATDALTDPDGKVIKFTPAAGTILTSGMMSNMLLVAAALEANVISVKTDNSQVTGSQKELTNLEEQTTNVNNNIVTVPTDNTQIGESEEELEKVSNLTAGIAKYTTPVRTDNSEVEKTEEGLKRVSGLTAGIANYTAPVKTDNSEIEKTEEELTVLQQDIDKTDDTKITPPTDNSNITTLGDEIKGLGDITPVIDVDTTEADKKIDDLIEKIWGPDGPPPGTAGIGKILPTSGSPENKNNQTENPKSSNLSQNSSKKKGTAGITNFTEKASGYNSSVEQLEEEAETKKEILDREVKDREEALAKEMKGIAEAEANAVKIREEISQQQEQTQREKEEKAAKIRDQQRADVNKLLSDAEKAAQRHYNTINQVSEEAKEKAKEEVEAKKEVIGQITEETVATNEFTESVNNAVEAQIAMIENEELAAEARKESEIGGISDEEIQKHINESNKAFNGLSRLYQSSGGSLLGLSSSYEYAKKLREEVEWLNENAPDKVPEGYTNYVNNLFNGEPSYKTPHGTGNLAPANIPEIVPETVQPDLSSQIEDLQQKKELLEAQAQQLENDAIHYASQGTEEAQNKLNEINESWAEVTEELFIVNQKIQELLNPDQETSDLGATEIEEGFIKATEATDNFSEAVQTASQQDTGDLGTPGSIAGMVALTDATNTVGGTVQAVSTYDITDLGAVYAKTQVDNLNQSLRNTATEITNIPSEKTVTINMVQNGTVEGTTATASGTAKWSFGRALAQGDIGALKTEEALVGELGPEMRVRGSKWELLGQNGPEFRDVRKGDIIFNADQTADLLSSGKTTSRGKAFANGNTMPEGHFSTYLNNANKYDGYGGYNPKKSSDDSVEKAANTVSDAASSASEETKSALDDIKDAWGRVIDWIQVKIENIEKQIEHATNAAERTYVSRAVREADYAKAIRNLEQESKILKNASKGYNDYGEKILKEGLSELGYSFKSGTIQAYGEAISDAVKAGVDLTRTQYGNIDLNNRQKLKVKGGTATVLGSSAEYDGVEIAYSPIQQTKNGAKLLSQKEVDEYIFSLIDRLGEGWKNEDLLKLDSVKNGGKGLIADIGETARAIGENMHLAEAVKFAKAKVPTGSNEEKEVLEAVMTKMAGGAIDITRYSEDAKTIIDEWMKWYDQKEAADEKALEIEQQRVDLVKERAELYLTENETMSSHINARNERIQSRIDSGTKYNTNTTIARYGRISGNTEDQIKLAEDRLKYLKDIQEQFKKGTEDWWEYQTQIDETTNNIDQLTDSIEKNNQAIVDLRIEKLNNRKDQIDYANSRIQSQIDNGYTLNQKGMMKGYKRINKNNTSQIGILSQELDILREAQSKVTKDSAKWWDYQKQINDVTTSIDDLTDSIRNNQKAMVDLQIEYQNNEIDKFQAEMDRVQTGMDMREAFNVSASAEQYQQLNAHITQQISLSQKQIGIIKQAQQSVKKGSTEWWNYQKSLDDTKNSTLELTQAIISNAQAMAELPMQEAERKNEKIENANSIIQSQMESVNETNAKKRNAYIRQEISNNGLKLGNTQVAYNQTKGNAKTARTSLGRTFDKSFDKANEEHEELLKRMMDSADGKNIISVDDIYKLARIIATNPTDAQALNAFYNSAIQYNAMIQAKDTAQNAYKLAKASQKAEAEASAQAMLANRQTARDKKIEKANAKFDIASSIFDNSVGRNFAYSQTKRDAETKKLNKENKYYNQELAGVNADLTATSTDIRSLVTTEKKANKNNAKYLAALKRIQSAVKAKKKIESSDISLVQGSSTELAGLLYAYNAQLDQTVIAREEQAAAYATNSARKAEIENEATEKRKTIVDNQIGRNDARAANAISASARNKLVANDNKQLRKKDEANAARTANFLNESDTQKTIFNQLGKKAVKQKGMPQVYASTIKHAMSVANQGKSIGSGDIERIYEGYVNGYISYDLYMACIDYNNAHEWYREAKYTEELELASNTTERAANRVAMIQNILTEGDNKRALRTYGSVGDKMRSTRNGTNKTQFNRDYAQEAGHYTNPQDINDDIFNAKVDLDQYQKDYKAAVKSYTQAIKNGDIQEGTDQWYEAQAAIETARQGIDNSKLAIKQLKNEMRDLEWTKFDDMMASIKRLNSEMSHFQTMIGNEMMFDEFNKGNITRYGMASATLHNEAYQANLQEAIMYKDELNKIQKQIRKGQLDATDKAVIDRQNELVDAIRETTEAAESEKQAMIDLVRQGYEAQLSYLNKTISKYKELKQSEKEAYDYHREISDSVENITNIQRQLAAFEGNSSEESVATVQRLQTELKKAQDDLQDRQYNKYLSDAQNMLDDLSSDFQEWIEFYMRDRDQVLIDIKEEISGVSHDLGGSLTSSDKIAARAIDTLRLSEEKLFEDQSKTVSTLGSNLKASIKDTSDTTEKPITDMATKYQKSIDDQQIKEEEEQKTMESQAKVAAEQYKTEQEEIKARNTEIVNQLIESEKDITESIHGVIDDFTNSDSTLTVDKATDALNSVKQALGIDIGDAAKTISDAIKLEKENGILEVEDKKAQEKQSKQDQKTAEQLTKDQIQADQKAFENAVEEMKKKKAAEAQEKAMDAIGYSGFKNALDAVKGSTGSASSKKKVTKKATATKTDSNDNLLIARAASDPEPVTKSKKKKSTTKTKPVVGDKVTFDSGVYHEASDGTGTTGSAYLGKSVYIVKVNNSDWAKYPYLISPTSNYDDGIGWVSLKQLKGYFKGGLVGSSQAGWTQEKGSEVIYRKSDGAMLTPLGAGDMVFTHAMSENLWNLAKMDIPSMIERSMSQPIVTNKQDISVSPNTSVQMNITLPNVKNYDEFKQAMLNDSQFQNSIQAMTLGAAMGQNSLSKYKYK